MDYTNSQTPASIAIAADEGEALVEQLIGLVGGLESTEDERRRRDRYPICCKMQLVPMDEHGRPFPVDAVTVFGKDLSRSGICFTHDLPLESKRFIISFVLGESGHFVVEAEANWSKRTLIGLYESGCRLIRKIGAPKLAKAR